MRYVFEKEIWFNNYEKKQKNEKNFMNEVGEIGAKYYATRLFSSRSEDYFGSG